MTGKTHIVGGAAAGLGYLLAAKAGLFGLEPFSVEGSIACGTLAALGALLPDIDSTSSKAGNAAKPVAAMTSALWGHRTITHSLLFVAILYAIGILFFPAFMYLYYAFLAGVASHLLLDMLNRVGVPLFYPFRHRFHIASIHNDSVGEHVVFATLVAGVAFEIYKLFGGVAL